MSDLINKYIVIATDDEGKEVVITPFVSREIKDIIYGGITTVRENCVDYIDVEKYIKLMLLGRYCKFTICKVQEVLLNELKSCAS